MSKGAFIVLGLAGATLIVYPLAVGTDLSHLSDLNLWWKKLARPLLRTLLFISVGLLIGQLIEGLGLTAKLGVLARPLTARANLPAEAGAAFTAAFASGVAANTLLFTAWQEGRLDRRQLIVANLLNASLPAYLLHLPTTFFIVYALLGKAALIYFGLTFVAALIRCLGVTLAGRMILPAAQSSHTTPEQKSKGWAAAFRDTWPKFLTRLKRLLIIILPVYVAVFLLLQWGFFTWLGQALAGIVSSAILPLEAMSVIVFSIMAEFTSGFAAAAAFLEAGSLTIKQVVIALLIGNVIATPVRVLRHQLPHYMGIYSPAMGIKLVAIGQSVRILSVVAVTLLFILIF